MTREELINKLCRRTAYDFESEAASMLQSDGETIAAMTGERDQLRAELAECKRDAERYRWLRRHHIRSDPDMSGRHHWMTLGRGLGRGVTAEEAIDAARKGGCEK